MPATAPATGDIAAAALRRDTSTSSTVASPARNIAANPPPFLVFHGTADPLVPLSQSKLLVEALKAKGAL